MIRAFVVDMDGTFLTDQKTFDQSLFMSLYKEMKMKNILFVVASGNQYAHLLTYFPELSEELIFIAENGACIIDKGQLIFEKVLDPEIVKETLHALNQNPIFKNYRLVLSGREGAYISENAPYAYAEKANRFYKNLQNVQDYLDVQDDIYKLALNFDIDKVELCLKYLESSFSERLLAVTSGHEAIDLVDPSVGKGTGIQFLKDNYHLQEDEIAVFGDNLNDLGMFTEVIYSYAMADSRLELKKNAYEIIGSNNEQAVLFKIADIMSSQKEG